MGDALDFDRNTHLQEAYEAALLANPLPAGMLKNSYQILRPLFSRANVLEVADTQVGLGYLNGWVPQSWPTDGNCGSAPSARGSCTSRQATVVLFRR